MSCENMLSKKDLDQCCQQILGRLDTGFNGVVESQNNNTQSILSRIDNGLQGILEVENANTQAIFNRIDNTNQKIDSCCENLSQEIQSVLTNLRADLKDLVGVINNNTKSILSKVEENKVGINFIINELLPTIVDIVIRTNEVQSTILTIQRLQGETLNNIYTNTIDIKFKCTEISLETNSINPNIERNVSFLHERLQSESVEIRNRIFKCCNELKGEIANGDASIEERLKSLEVLLSLIQTIIGLLS